jgi:long-chain fatty acid transport protein
LKMFIYTKPTAGWLLPCHSWFLLGCTCGITTNALAAGFALPEQNASGLGNAYAGAAAIAEDASTIFYNPAGLTRLSGQQIVLSGRLYLPSNQFIHQATNVLSKMPITGGNGGDSDAITALPSFYYAYSYSPTLKFGLGLNTPFGSKVEYDKDWLGRYNLIKHETLTANISPTIAYKLTDKLSLGAGLNIHYTKSMLSHAIPTLDTDALVQVTQDDWGLGYNLGALYEFTPTTRVGVDFRSSVNHKLTGTAKFTGISFLKQSNASTRIDLPESVALSVFHQCTSRLAVMADVTWTHWSRWQTLVTQLSNPPLPTTINPLHWHDSWRYSLGVTFQPYQRWKLRAGVAYENSAVTAAFRTSNTPQSDQIWLAVGLAYQLTKTSTVDFGYVHQFIFQGNIENPKRLVEPQPDQMSIIQEHFDSSMDVLGVQLSYTF